jgi:hypothetical protein
MHAASDSGTATARALNTKIRICFTAHMCIVSPIRSIRPMNGKGREQLSPRA